ncbi:MAG: amidophosphoribosyltransferase [Acidobacteria bacterium]|nr:amidophosphoribosyltransferase [Acidobacteriota bacterium]
MRSDKFHDECGVYGVFDHAEAARVAFLGLYALQHRGQESAGIAHLNGGGRIKVLKGMGHVSDIFREADLSTMRGYNAVGHVRYSTAGESHLLNAQPILIDSHRGQIALVHNGNLVNALQLRSQLEKEGAIFQSTSDSEVILHLIARSRAESFEDALTEALMQVKGAFSLVFLTPEKMYAVRDPRGFRPLSLGRLGESTLAASETCAFDIVDAEWIRDVAPGELVVISRDGIRSLTPFPPEKPAQCIFEHVYFSRPDSTVYGRSVNLTRNLLGRGLAREHPADADLVVPVPDSGVCAAIGFSQESGIPFEFALIRNHYVGRTFIEPKQSIRNFGVRVKLNPVRGLLEGKRVIVIDDSIVRGTTSRKIVKMVRMAGAKEVHFRVSCPPTIGSCYYGIDTPYPKDLIASSHTVEEIRRFLDADSLGYLSLEGLMRAVGHDDRYCTACYTLKYPVEFPQEQLAQLKLFQKEDEIEDIRQRPLAVGELVRRD